MVNKLMGMSLEELWQLFPIFLSEPDDDWSRWYDSEREFLQKILPEQQIRQISHVGSTAIKGIWAKPIIDILVEIEPGSDMRSMKETLTANGYLCMTESKSRISLNKGYTEDGFARKVFHLHLRQAGDNDELSFRDYLNRHPEAARRYEALKLKLWKQYEHNRDAYTDNKADFVTEIMNNCKKESIIETYFKMWVERDFSGLNDIFAPDIYYSECYGPEYRGYDEINKWIDKMLKEQTVLEWPVSRFIHQGNTVVTEWLFRDRSNGTENEFDGVSVIEFNDDMTITSIKEFSSKREHIRPFGPFTEAEEKKEEPVEYAMKAVILERLCYTDLVYDRINKKLKLSLEPEAVRDYVYQTVKSEDCVITRRGKNYYAGNEKEGVRITINSYNYRIITADRITVSSG